MHKYENRAKKLQQIFEDTQNQIVTDTRLLKATEKMIEKTIVYTDDMSELSVRRSFLNSSLEVVEDTTFHCARKYVKSGKVAVLNFANAIHPGGGASRGALAQEECLCRSSNLYRGLISPMMLENYYKKNKRLPDAFGSDRVAYHPGVTVFKDDELYANQLSVEEWFEVDVITCAAPRINPYFPMSDEILYETHVNRGRRILHAAIKNDAEILVLGAFGCGAFANDPEIVAKAYKHLLVEEGYLNCFQKVVFAIKKDHNDVRGNYDWFKKVLKGE